MNALDTELKTALRDALAGLAEDPAVRAVVLTGVGRHHLGHQAQLESLLRGQRRAEQQELLRLGHPDQAGQRPR
ncbi:MAG TPA: hypothetical protein VF423_03020 [Actinomycetes bacterium]